MALPRMRTAAGVLAIIKEMDPGTAINEHNIRVLLRSGQIQVVPVGKKILVDADKVIDYLASGQANLDPKPHQKTPGIRPVKE